MYCNKCGREIPDDSLFCNKCGCKVEINTENVVEKPTYNKDSNSTYYKLSKAKNRILLVVIISIIIVFCLTKCYKSQSDKSSYSSSNYSYSYNDDDYSSYEVTTTEYKPSLSITAKEAYQDGDYAYCNATISNTGNTTYSYVKVKVTYYDESYTILTTDWTYAVGSEGIEAGENIQFDMMTKIKGDMERYKLEILYD